MQVLDTLVPGFEQAVERLPGARETLRRLQVARQEGMVSDRSQALIGIAVAHRVGGSYARWVMERAASRAGINAEDILLASLGTAVRAREQKIVRAAWQSTVSVKSAGSLAPHIEYAALASTVIGMLAPSLGAVEQTSRKG